MKSLKLPGRNLVVSIASIQMDCDLSKEMAILLLYRRFKPFPVNRAAPGIVAIKHDNGFFTNPLVDSEHSY